MIRIVHEFPFALVRTRASRGTTGAIALLLTIAAALVADAPALADNPVDKAAAATAAVDAKAAQVVGVTNTAASTVEKGKAVLDGGKKAFGFAKRFMKNDKNKAVAELAAPAVPATAPVVAGEADSVGRAAAAATAAPTAPAPGAVLVPAQALLECEPVTGRSGEAVTLACTVTNAAGAPVAGVNVFFSIQQGSAWQVLGFAKSGADGVASLAYAIDYKFTGTSPTAVLSYQAEIKSGNPRVLPAKTEGQIVVRR